MNKILLIDCSPEVSKAVADLLGDNVTLENSSFGDEFVPKDFSMIILESDKGMDSILQKIGDIRRDCNFSNVPIVVIKQQEDHIPMEHFFTAGATEVRF